jgi:hypothetical protein
MKNKAFNFVILIIFLTFLPCVRLNALSFTDLSTAMTSIFSEFASDAEGTTAYRSLLIPVGGRAESMGNAFSGLCDDVSYINYNPGASSILKETQAGLFHNEWIADSKMEALSYTTRFGNFGFGVQLNCFYVPFTEYNIQGERVASNYYTETILALNASYNFLAGYDFKGFASGVSFKTAWRGVPDFTDNNTNEIRSFSGLGQSGMAFMLDLGLVLQFNFLKYFASRDPNVRIGFAAQNIGVGFTGLGSKSGFRLDDPLPTIVSAGISVKFFPFLTVAADIKQPLNLLDITNYQIFSFSIGADFSFHENFSILTGLEIKGGNPKISVGGEFEYKQMRLNVNYTLDLTSSLNPVNRISLSGKMLLGDRGRAKVQEEIDKLYSEGLVYYYSSEWEKAIETWEKVLEIDKRYDPAILGIESAKAQMSMIQKVRDTMFFEE